MSTSYFRVWPGYAGVGVSEWAAETMGIWQDKGGLTTQQIENKVMECVWEIAQSMRIINKQGAGPKQWDLLINCCVTWISDLEANRSLGKWYMAVKTNLAGQTLKVALDEFAEFGLCWKKNRLEETPTMKWKFMHVCMYFIAPMLLLLFLMMWRSRRWQGRMLRSQVFTDNGALRRLDRFPRPAI